MRAIVEALNLCTTITIESSPSKIVDNINYYVHLDYLTAEGVSLATQLADVERRKAAGEANVWAKRIVHGTRRDGSDMYWQIYKTATPAERAAKMAEKAEKAAGEKMAPHIK